MRALFIILFIASLSGSLFGQQTGPVDYPALGIRFTIPEGWVGQEGDGGFMIGHYTIPGIIILSPHEVRQMEDMKREARAGMYDEQGTALQLSGTLQDLSPTAIAGNYQGSLQGTPAKAYAIGVINNVGTGVNIIAVSTPAEYSPALEKAAMDVYRSLELKKAETGPIIEEWQNALSNSRLTFLESYNSAPSYDGAIGGGMNSKTQIDLCSQGYFNFYESSSVSLGGDGISGSSSGRGQGSGTWSIKAEYGAPVLVLSFHDGSVRSFELQYQDEKIFLNGKRFMRTTSGEYAPACY